MSQDIQNNVNEKPTLERKKTPLRQLNADKTTIPRDDQLGQEKWKEPTAFDASKPITDKPITDKPGGRTIEITEVEYHFPKAGQEKSGELLSDKPVTDFSAQPAADFDQNRPGVWEGTKDKVCQGADVAKDKVIQGAEIAKDKVQQGVELAKEKLAPTTTTTTTPDSELTENKPGVFERVKGALSHGVEKAKGVFTGPTRWSEPTELHPGNGYDWKRVVGEQGEVRWVATNDWSGDSANRGGIIEGAKGMVRSGVEKAKGLISRPDTKESEVTDYNQPDQNKPGVLQGAKDKVWQGVEKAKSVFSSSGAPVEEEHPGKPLTWTKDPGDQGEVHWQENSDWSGDSAAQPQKPGVLQGAKDKVMQGVEKAKGMFTSTKPTEATTTTDVPLAQEQESVPSTKPVGWKRVEIEREQTPSGYGREKVAIEKSADPNYKDPTMLKDQTGTYIS